MLIRPHDRDHDQRWRAFVVAQGFGQLVAAGLDRAVPVAVPSQFSLVDDEVWCHLAADNPLFEALAERPIALLSVAGDWAYIPGAWKAIPPEDPRRGLPTTYYAAVQLSGPVTVEEDPAAIAAVLRRQLAELEPDGDHVDPLEHGARLRAIRGVRLRIESVRAKFKYGGNVDQAHRALVAQRLAERDGPGDRAALAQLRLEPPAIS